MLITDPINFKLNRLISDDHLRLCGSYSSTILGKVDPCSATQTAVSYRRLVHRQLLLLLLLCDLRIINVSLSYSRTCSTQNE